MQVGGPVVTMALVTTPAVYLATDLASRGGTISRIPNIDQILSWFQADARNAVALMEWEALMWVPISKHMFVGPTFVSPPVR